MATLSSIDSSAGTRHGFAASRPALLAVNVLLAAGLLAGCSQQQQAASTGQRAPVPVKVAKVTKGSIAATLSYSGELQPVDQVDMMASAGGRLQDVFVEEGQEVDAGTPLASLETDVLEAQVRQADANLQGARAKLDQLLQGAKPEEIAAAQASLDAQRARMASLIGENGAGTEAVARANLVSVQTKANTDLESAQAAVDTARANLASAEAKKQQLLNPTPEDIAAAQAAITAAQDGVNSARAKLAALKNPAELDVSAARVAMDAARADLDSKKAKLDEVKAGPKDADVAAARKDLATAQAAQRSAESAIAKVTQPLNDEKLKTLIDAYRALAVARDKLAGDQARGAAADVLAADQNGILLALQKVEAAEKETNTFVAGVKIEEIIEKEAALESAKSTVASAQAKLDQLLATPTATDLQAAQSAFDAATATLQSKQVALDRLLHPTSADIAAAQAAVTAAESTLTTSQNRLRALQNPTAADVQAADSAIETARAALQTAEARVELLSGGSSAADIEAARAAVVKAQGDISAQQAAVAQAEQQLVQVQNRVGDTDIAAATATVAQAEAALDVARINLNRATLVAPFPAVVAKKNFSRGAAVSAQSAIVTLVSQDTYVAFNVEEAMLGRLHTGLPVSFTVASFGNRAFRGRITSIAPTADSSSRTFRVRVTPDGGQQGLRPGMFASLTVSVDTQNDALLVPPEALVQRGQSNVVYVVKDGVVEQREVQVGLRNDKSVQIREGLEEGEDVVIQGNRALRDGDRVNIAG